MHPKSERSQVARKIDQPRRRKGRVALGKTPRNARVTVAVEKREKRRLEALARMKGRTAVGPMLRERSVNDLLAEYEAFRAQQEQTTAAASV